MTGTAGYSDLITATPGLIGYWHLGEASGAAVDSVGANDLTAGGTLTRNFAGGPYAGDGAIRQSSSGYLQRTSPTGLPTGSAARSVEFWYRANGANNRQTIFSYGIQSTRRSFCPTVNQNGNGTNTLGIWVYGDDHYLSAGQISQNCWHHCVFTYAAGSTQCKIYLDGRYLGAVTFGAALNTGVDGNGLVFGRDYFQSAAFLTGSLDEVALYDVELDLATIVTHFAAGGARGQDLARFAEEYIARSIYANSEYNASYIAANAVNGNYDTSSGGGGISWAQGLYSNNGWWHLEWNVAQWIDHIGLWDRGPTGGGSAFFGTNGHVVFEDGSSETWSGLTDGGSVDFSFAGRLTRWLRIYADAGAREYAGLAEVEARYDDSVDHMAATGYATDASTTAYVTIPRGSKPGDLVIVAIGRQVNSITTPTGWNLLDEIVVNAGFGYFVHTVFWRILDGTEGPAFSTSVSGSTKFIDFALTIPAGTFNPSSPISSHTKHGINGNTASAVATGLTEPLSDRLILLTGSSGCTVASTPWPSVSGWSSYGNYSRTNSSSDLNNSAGAWVKDDYDGSATGDITVTEASGAVGAKSAMLIAISKPITPVASRGTFAQVIA